MSAGHRCLPSVAGASLMALMGLVLHDPRSFFVCSPKSVRRGETWEKYPSRLGLHPRRLTIGRGIFVAGMQLHPIAACADVVFMTTW